MRNRSWKYLFPVLYGLVVYFTIRLLLDSVTGMKFWERRRWGQTSLEIVYTVLVSFIFVWVFRRLFRWFDQRWPHEYSTRRIVRELLYVFLVNLIFQNAFLTTFCALTDDGAQWYDIADVNTIPLLYVLIYYGIVRSRTFLKAYIDGKIQLEKITNDQLQTELKFLKAQYHPHFLFNALNTIYFQMDENVAEAKKSVEKFSELLRYQLYDQQQTVPVSQEVRYLQNFIELQEIRSSDKLQLSVHFDGKLNGQQIYPLLMLPLVENAFKYVGGDYWIRIEALVDRDELHFSVTNATPGKIPIPVSDQKAGGIGLDNLRRRLQLLYPEKHHLRIEKKEGEFLADLVLKFNS
ncbi:MAG: sensor histidine kinase [Chitinophagaceae bacterium]|nr:sensor histidine kinase [Chitinophagaceae bacterium]